MNTLKRWWRKISSDPTFAQCPCASCDGNFRSTVGMIRDAGEFYCSEDAIDEVRAKRAW